MSALDFHELVFFYCIFLPNLEMDDGILAYLVGNKNTVRKTKP